LESASELLFVGDAGTTKASRPSTRIGVEWTQAYKLNRQWALDTDLAWSNARFKNLGAEGNFIPGAITTTANIGVRFEPISPWSGALRLRYFGPRPLTEDGSIQSAASWLLNLRVGYKLTERTRWSLDVYNLLNSQPHDVEYWYASQLRGEAQAVLDRLVHPAEPRTARLTVTHRFE
jgi:outer membrane receptor protein involved in Fe transport